MRLFELLLLVSLLLSASGLLLLKNAKQKMMLPALSVVLSIINTAAEGFRFAMFPAIVLTLVIFAFSLSKFFIKPTKKHRVLKVLGMIGFCLAYFVSVSLPSFLAVINLPKPTGSAAIGTIRLDFTEPNRKNILTQVSSAQKIAVQVWYPASGVNGYKRATWMDNRQTASLFAKKERLPDIFGQLDLIKTNSYWGAPLLKTEDKYPVILFSGGGGMFSSQNTVQMEELASQGYVVFAVSHPYDDFAAVYADGSIVSVSAEQSDALSKEDMQAVSAAKKQVSDEKSPAFQRAVIQNCKLNSEDIRAWSVDLRFVADEIEKLNDGNIPSIFKGKLDPDNMGIFGHSFGGAAAGEACLQDSRFKAFINLDGTPFGDTVDHVISQPFMVMEEGTDGYYKLIPSNGYAKEQKNFLIVRINGAQHMNFSDLNTIVPFAGKALGALGKIDTSRQTKIMNSYIVSFFNKYLKGDNVPLLDQTPLNYAEVTIEAR